MGTERAWDNPKRMISVDDALARILARISPLPHVELPINDALGMVVARDVVSSVDVPPFRNSAMDGYAVRSVDTAAGRVSLRVTTTVAAGSVADRAISSGEAIRIMTGAPVPTGADAVVRFEETDERSRDGNDEDPQITISRPVQPGENVRPAGEDICAGDVVVPAGTVMGPVAVGALASIGQATVSVYRRPRVAILSTGDELVALSSTLSGGQIRDSNGPMLAALVQQAGGEAVPLGVAGDQAAELQTRLSGLSDFEFIISSGGVSVGDYDVVKDVLSRDGTIDIWQVRMKPGKPLAFGLLRGTPLLGLPGNPGAAFVSFLQFGRPAIRRMLGHERVTPPVFEATLQERVENPGKRRHFMRGVVERTARGLEARPAGGHGSGQLMPFIRSNCLIVIPESCEVVERGATIHVQTLDDALMM